MAMDLKEVEDPPDAHMPGADAGCQCIYSEKIAANYGEHLIG